jgi:hypothetical protein
MTRLTRIAWTAAVALSGLAATTAHAETPIRDFGSFRQLIASLNYDADGRVTAEGVGALLRDAGYTPTRCVHPEGRTYFEIPITFGTFKGKATLALTPDGEHVSLYTTLINVDLRALSAADLTALLAANNSQVGIAFSLFRLEGQDKLSLDGYFSSRNVTPVALVREINRFTTVANNTSNLWNPLRLTASR